MLNSHPEPRCMLHLAPSGSPQALQERVLEAADSMIMMFTPLIRLDGGISTPNAPFAAGLEAPGGAALNTEYFAEFLAALDGAHDPASSVVLCGRDHWFVDVDNDAEITTVRFQYLMRRRSDFSHDQYCDRYRDVHSEFGVKTPGIVGYVQCHVDLAESSAMATQLGITPHEVDSVSELYLESLDVFYAALGTDPDVGLAAEEDEKRFVDRAASQMYTSTVHHQGEFIDLDLDI